MNVSEYLAGLRRIYSEFGAVLELAPGCTEDALAKAETRLGFPLDPMLREIWKLAGGSRDGVRLFARPGFLTGYDLLSIEAALDERETRRRIAPNYDGYVADEPRDVRIRPGWFQEGWLPFAGFAEGTLVLIQDYSPAPAGKIGQIIAFTHDPDEIGYVAPDFASFLSASLASIKGEPEDFLGLY